jgi:hypothetical protein
MNILSKIRHIVLLMSLSTMITVPAFSGASDDELLNPKTSSPGGIPKQNNYIKTNIDLSPYSITEPLHLIVSGKKRARTEAFGNEEAMVCEGTEGPKIKETIPYAAPHMGIKQNPWPTHIIFKSLLTKTEYVLYFTQSAEIEVGTFKLTEKTGEQEERIIPFRSQKPGVLTVFECLRCLKKAGMFSEVDKRSYNVERLTVYSDYSRLRDININHDRVINHLTKNRFIIEFQFKSLMHDGYVLTEKGIKSVFSSEGRVDVGGIKEIDFCRFGIEEEG